MRYNEYKQEDINVSTIERYSVVGGREKVRISFECCQLSLILSTEPECS